MPEIKKDLGFTSAELLALMQILYTSGDVPRLVGGCVRDKLLGIEPKDIDIATKLSAQHVLDLLKQNSVQAIPTGIKYGTITAIIGGKSFEITTLRKDVNCDGRWAEVEFTDDFQEDAKRRDFTINALSYCPKTHLIFDYFNGLQHLQTRQVVFINQAQERIKEDYLRILRFFRFSAYYANEFDALGTLACAKHAKNLTSLSRERINTEFDKILLSPKAIETLKIMGVKILDNLLPGIITSIEKLQQGLTLAENFKIELDVDFRYALLFLQNNKLNFTTLKFSKKRSKIITQAIDLANHNNLDNIELILKKLWLQGYFPAQFTILAASLGLLKVNIAKEFIHIFAQNPPKFILNGEQIKKMGYNGKNIGLVLNYLEKIWIEKNFCISATQLLKFLDK